MTNVRSKDKCVTNERKSQVCGVLFLKKSFILCHGGEGRCQTHHANISHRSSVELRSGDREGHSTAFPFFPLSFVSLFIYAGFFFNFSPVLKSVGLSLNLPFSDRAVCLNIFHLPSGELYRKSDLQGTYLSAHFCSGAITSSLSRITSDASAGQQL